MGGIAKTNPRNRFKVPGVAVSGFKRQRTLSGTLREPVKEAIKPGSTYDHIQCIKYFRKIGFATTAIEFFRISRELLLEIEANKLI